MKRYIVISALLAVAVGSASGFIFGGRRRMAPTGVELSVQDIREHGLAIVGPGDASFDGMLNGAREHMSGVPLDVIRPYTVFIKNTGRRAVVAFVLKWELVRPDGKANTRTDQYITKYSLMGDGVSDSEGHAIKPNTAWLAFPGFAAAQDTPIWDSGGPKVAAYFDSTSNDLAQFSKISVSLDGVFFEDGAFVGPDTTGFYGKVEAMIRANQDLRDELEKRKKSGKSADDVFTPATEEAGKPKVRLGRNSMADDYYNHFKRLAAEELLEMRAASGNEKTLEHALRPPKGPRPVLRKE